MNEPEQSRADACDSSSNGEQAGDRRAFLGQVLGLGVFALGTAPALGQSLLLRTMAPVPSFVVDTPTTLTYVRSNSYVVTGTVAPTIVFTGTRSPPEKPGTFTTSAPPQETATFSQTITFPAPGGTSQPVTIAGTYKLSYTPPATNIQTGSWTGNSWTITNSRSPTYWTVTITEIRTFSYTSTTPSDDEVEQAPVPDSIEVARKTIDDVLVECINAGQVDLLDVRSRNSQPRYLKFVCGAGR